MATVGVYSVMSYSVNARTRELGIRVALGADARTVLRLVVGEGLTMAGVGIAAGALASLGLTRVLATQPLRRLERSLLLLLQILVVALLAAAAAQKGDG